MNTAEQLPSTAQEDERAEPIGDATYSPEDNKIRIFPFDRLDTPTFQRLKAEGFKWGRFQGNFVAPMWTPSRWDLALELCGEIGDDTQTTEDRVAQRAERFARYKENRHRDAYAAAARVEQLTDGIPLGQPILVGHHSQAKAEKHAQKIKNAMGHAVDQWSRHEYWTERIPAVLRHAEYKAQDPVRHRRIKGLEADERKFSKELDRHAFYLEKWSAEGITSARAWQLANADRSGAYDILRNWDRANATENEYLSEVPAETLAAAIAHAIKVHGHTGRGVVHYTRWLDHTRLRLAYEREIMAQGGGDMRERHEFEAGGVITCGRFGGALTVLKVNKAAGRINSLTCNTPEGERHWRGSQCIIKVEEVKSYEAPQAGAEVPKAVRRKPLPLCNYPSADAVSMTAAEYKAIPERHRENAPAYPEGKRQWEARATHRRTRAWIEGADAWGGTHKWVYLTDKKTTHPPADKTTPPQEPAPTPEPVEEMPEPTLAEVVGSAEEPTPAPQTPPTNPFDQMAATLRGGGVQTAVADQLYPTPPELATRMVELAEVEAGMCVLEPSAGTGNIVQAVRDAVDTEVRAYEINMGLCSKVRQRFQPYECAIDQADFLEVTEFMGQFPRIIMNPPFANASDIKHIEHALKFLAPGGRLVAICANGPRQRDRLMPLATHWEDLPAGTFKNAGTMVNTALVVIDA